VRPITTLDGSGTMKEAGGVEKVEASEMTPPAPAGLCEKVMEKLAVKGPIPLKPPCVPGVQFPSKAMFRKPAGDGSKKIWVLVKVPKTLLPKVRLVPLLVLNDTGPKSCEGMPAKTPELFIVETRSPIMKLVAVLMSPVLEPSAVGAPMSTKAWVPVGTEPACTPDVGSRLIAQADSPKRIARCIENLIVVMLE